MNPEVEKVKKYVREHEQELRRKYGNYYIAVLGEVGVIDYDENDRFALSERINKRTHLAISPLIGTIDEILKPREVHLPSPRIRR